ncbi:MAG: LytTR family DNA-binding domain-containing protein [Desulfarculaceae bacterium]|nr:LytTR family DNA-binding domain-containing protein [Desulfarculaceae bacterium]
MPDLRVIIVDDEPMARQALKRMLADFPEIELCGEADSVDQAERLIKETRAGVVFLDIELCGESGFELVPKLDNETAVVFVTAFNEYAIRAFEVNALDYLLKPVTKDRLAESIRRLGERQGQRAPSASSEGLHEDDVILVQDGKQRRWLDLKHVCLIEANGDFTLLRSADGGSGTVWRSLRQWEELLPPDQFVRIHRGMIVNLEQVEAFESLPGNRLKLCLRGVAESCVASRRLTPQIRKRLSSLAD